MNERLNVNECLRILSEFAHEADMSISDYSDLLYDYIEDHEDWDDSPLHAVYDEMRPFMPAWDDKTREDRLYDVLEVLPREGN